MPTTYDGKIFYAPDELRLHLIRHGMPKEQANSEYINLWYKGLSSGIDIYPSGGTSTTFSPIPTSEIDKTIINSPTQTSTTPTITEKNPPSFYNYDWYKSHYYGQYQQFGDKLFSDWVKLVQSGWDPQKATAQILGWYKSHYYGQYQQLGS